MRRIFICVLFACMVLVYTSAAAYFASEAGDCTGEYTCSSDEAVVDLPSLSGVLLLEGDLYEKY